MPLPSTALPAVFKRCKFAFSASLCAKVVPAIKEFIYALHALLGYLVRESDGLCGDEFAKDLQALRCSGTGGGGGGGGTETCPTINLAVVVTPGDGTITFEFTSSHLTSQYQYDIQEWDGAAWVDVTDSNPCSLGGFTHVATSLVNGDAYRIRAKVKKTGCADSAWFEAVGTPITCLNVGSFTAEIVELTYPGCTPTPGFDCTYKAVSVTGSFKAGSQFFGDIVDVKYVPVSSSNGYAGVQVSQNNESYPQFTASEDGVAIWPIPSTSTTGVRSVRVTAVSAVGCGFYSGPSAYKKHAPVTELALYPDAPTANDVIQRVYSAPNAYSPPNKTSISIQNRFSPAGTGSWNWSSRYVVKAIEIDSNGVESGAWVDVYEHQQDGISNPQSAIIPSTNSISIEMRKCDWPVDAWYSSGEVFKFAKRYKVKVVGYREDGTASPDSNSVTIEQNDPISNC